MLEIPHPVAKTTCASGEAPIVIVCAHASTNIPDCLDNLGVDAEVRPSHSRLAHDCNRPLTAPDCIPSVSENYAIPGNQGLSEGDRLQRCEQIHDAFHEVVSRTVTSQQQCGDSSITRVTVHSFTPVYNGEERTVEIEKAEDVACHLADTLSFAIDASNEVSESN